MGTYVDGCHDVHERGWGEYDHEGSGGTSVRAFACIESGRIEMGVNGRVGEGKVAAEEQRNTLTENFRSSLKCYVPIQAGAC